MAERLHGIDTSWSSYTGNYSQREPGDKEKFEANWDLIFGKKDLQSKEQDDDSSSNQSRA